MKNLIVLSIFLASFGATASGYFHSGLTAVDQSLKSESKSMLGKQVCKFDGSNKVYIGVNEDPVYYFKGKMADNSDGRFAKGEMKSVIEQQVTKCKFKLHNVCRREETYMVAKGAVYEICYSESA